MPSGSHVVAPLATLAAREPGSHCVVHPEKLSARKLARAVASVERELLRHLRAGTVAAVAAEEQHVLFLLILAAASAGLAPAPLHARWQANEAATACATVGAQTLIHDGSLPHLACACEHQLQMPQPLEANDGCAHALPACAFFDESTDVALICFTSGTSGGSPKGAALTHTGVTTASLCKTACVDVSPDDICLPVAPLFHVGGFSFAHAALQSGASLAFPPSHRLQASIDTLCSPCRITAVSATPPALQGLGEQVPAVEDVRVVLIGGGATSSTTVRSATTLFPQSLVVCSYGMTEATSSITFGVKAMPADGGASAPPGSHICSDITSAGKPAPGLSVWIEGATGEILLHGQQLSAGYWSRSGGLVRHSAALRTGDIGAFSRSGELLVLGRAKDVIRSGAESVQAAEVESALSCHLGTDQLAAIPVPTSSTLGEAVGVLVSRRSSESFECSLEKLKENLSELGLASFKVPRVLALTERPLPRNSGGKIDKREALKLLLSSNSLQSDNVLRGSLPRVDDLPSA